MTIYTDNPSSNYEQIVLEIMRKLPQERLAHLVEFAHFLEFQEEKAASGDEKWEQLLAEPESPYLLQKLAHEARSEISAGSTTDIAVTEDGKLTSE